MPHDPEKYILDMLSSAEFLVEFTREKNLVLCHI
jgi:hypothetical protein